MRVVVLLLLVAACDPSTMSTTDAGSDVPLCGNGVLDTGEACDTGGDTAECIACALAEGDAGVDASEDASVDASDDAGGDAGDDDGGVVLCGNGALDQGEECDTSGDTTACVGCVVTDGYSCTGAPSTCTSAPRATVTTATVSEAALASGTTPSATTEVASGTLVVDFGIDGPGAITWGTDVTSESALTSGGVPITFAIESGDLVGRAGPFEALRIAGDFTATLGRAFDHAGDLVLRVPYIVTDADGTSVTSHLNLAIADDGPQQNAVLLTSEDADEAANLLLMVQVSGGMANPSGLTGVSKLDLTRAFLDELLARRPSSSRVRLVTFSSTAMVFGSTWLTVDEARPAIDSLVPGGNTNFDAAVATAQTSFPAAGRLVGARNEAHFLSNGAPNAAGGTGSIGIVGAEITAWQNFVSSNDIDSFAWGVGPDADLAPLHALAYDGIGLIDRNAILVTEPWNGTIVGTLGGQVYGTVYAGMSGADGNGGIAALTIDGSTYAFERTTNTIAVTGTNRSTFNVITSVLSITTLAGGTIRLGMISGQLEYTATASTNESATLTVRDGDGTTSINTLGLVFGDGSLPMIVRRRRVLSNMGGANQTFGVSLQALKANDSPQSYSVALGTATNVSGVLNATALFLTDTNTDGGSVNLICTDGTESRTKLATLDRTQAGEAALDGTGLDEILLGRPLTSDTLNGYEGHDWLEGSSGNDVLNAGAGDDVLIGGAGNDTLTGGAGRDRFVGAQATDGNDTITDFVSGQDVIDLRALFDAAGVPASARAARVQISGGGLHLVAIDLAGNGTFTTMFTVTGSGPLIIGTNVIVQ